MTNLIKMELYKLRHSVEFKVLLALLLVLSLAISFLLAKVGGVWQENLVSALFDSALGEIFICIFAGLFIGNEFSGQMINLEIISGHSRRNILLSKAFSFLIGFAIIITIYPVFSVIASFALQGFKGSFSFSDLMYIIKILAFNFMIYTKVAGLLIFFGFLFKNSGKIISASILAIVVKTVVINYLADKLTAKSFFNRYFGLRQFNLVLFDNPTMDVFKVIVFSLLVFAGFLWLTYIVFEKLELR